MSKPACLVVPIGEEHIDSFRAAVDSVARERRYLALLEAPPEADTRAYVKDNIKERAPHFVALADGKVVGWCDIAVRPRATQRHSRSSGTPIAKSRTKNPRERLNFVR